MNYRQLIRHFGTQSEAARQLGIPQSTVSAWRESFPRWRQEWVDARVRQQGLPLKQSNGKR